MIVVDSSVWIDHFSNRLGPAVERLRSMAPLSQVLVGDIVLIEVLRGARNEEQARKIEGRLLVFEIERMLDVDLALKAAANHRRLRGLGITIRSMPDLVIGTCCIERGHRLLHQDRDFDPMVEHLGLKIA
ncbi:MAG: VapC toxin family PIN domain ribonuclease [Ancylobacter novellus]|uniref:Ribonuclease VapC n=1 Tax=Ancylobacter novellus TaxID=921 RepID=A0A2W5MBI8_ANCNO|nr:MAG: VapC toxin family PIN domain ribonuclease [Ancylobacter novellus]